jgi:hypothetical protein
MARAWYIAGQPEPDSPVMGSYQAWCRVVGGILNFSGIAGFLGNLDAMYEKADTEGREWEAFLSAWRHHYGDAVVLVKRLVKEIQKEEVGRRTFAQSPATMSKRKRLRHIGRTCAAGKGRAFRRQRGFTGVVPEADKNQELTVEVLTC